MKKGKVIELKTLEDVLAAVNEDNIGHFLQDFSMWLGIRVGANKIGAKDKNYGVMRWIDDEKHDINVKIEITD